MHEYYVQILLICSLLFGYLFAPLRLYGTLSNWLGMYSLPVCDQLQGHHQYRWVYFIKRFKYSRYNRVTLDSIHCDNTLSIWSASLAGSNKH